MIKISESPEYMEINNIVLTYRTKNNLLEINIILPNELESFTNELDLENLLTALKTTFKNNNLRYISLTDSLIRVKGELIENE